MTKWKETEFGKIPEEWEVFPIGDYIKIVKGVSYRNKDYCSENEGLIFVNLKCVGRNGGFRNEGIKYIKSAPKQEQFVDYGDILIANTDLTQNREVIGSPIRVPKFERKACLSLDLSKLVVKNGNLDSVFLYYYLKSPFARKFMIANGTGTTVIHLAVSNVPNMLIVVPPLREQHDIAKILSDLDSKIELNQQMNKTLEDIAQAIFKRWFIDFEFPNEEGKPYKSSGGEMVESELGMIPRGWEVKFIEDLFIFKKGEEVGSKNYSDSQNSDFIQFYRVHDISSYGNQSKTYVDKKLIKTGFFKNDDILVSLDGTIGRVYFGGNGAYSSGIRKIESKYSFLGKGAILSLLKSELFQNELILYSADATTIKHASAAIKNIKIVYNKNILERYSKVTEPIFNMMLNNVNNDSSLINIRDFLLPKLMTGKIRVPIKGFT